MMRNFLSLFVSVLLLISACKKDDPQTPLDVTLNSGVFILNQGTIGATNASLSFIDHDDDKLYNGLYNSVNLSQLGDVALSISLHNNKAYMVVSNSGAIQAIDVTNAKSAGSISNLGSPRHMQLVNDQKAYVSDLYSYNLSIVNPSTYEITGTIPLGRTSEEMAIIDDKVYVANWSNFNQGSIVNDKILVVDSNLDSLIGNIQVGIEPNSLVVDKNKHLWVLCSGGYNHVEKASLWKIDGNTDSVLSVMTFSNQLFYPSNLEINGTGDTLFYLNNGVFKLPIDADEFASEPFISENSERDYKFLGVDPANNDFYVSNPLDNISDGIVYRFNKKGHFISQVNTGIVPGAFGFK